MITSDTKKTNKYVMARFLEKIAINAGIGKLRNQPNFDDKILPEIERELAIITGQKPAERKAKKSIAGFKIREGEVVGLQITLRGMRMDEFLKRIVAVVFPRVRDFRGLNIENIDANGNLNVGFKDQYVFPEINIEKSKIAFGIQVTCVPRIKNREEAIGFYRNSGVPLKRLVQKSERGSK